MNTNAPVPVNSSLAGLNFPTLLGRSLPHSLEFERFHISSSSTLSSFSIDGCLLDAVGGATRAAM